MEQSHAPGPLAHRSGKEVMDSKIAGTGEPQTERTTSLSFDRPLRFLTKRDVQAIDNALEAVGPFGEVRLIKNRGRLRFIQTVRSEDVRDAR
jgi:hypothetical protein